MRTLPDDYLETDEINDDLQQWRWQEEENNLLARARQATSLRRQSALGDAPADANNKFTTVMVTCSPR